jgi:Arylsulfotransferase (ASST)
MKAVRALAVLLVIGGSACSETAGRARVLAGATTLQSLPELQVPVVKVVARDPTARRSGYLFVAEKKGGRAGGPMILDDHGRVRWYHQVDPPLETTDFRVQRYRGRAVLTWWQGTLNKAGIGRGSYEIYDASYRRIAEVHAAHGLEGDLHEFQLTPRGTAYITAYRAVPADLRGVGGSRHGHVEDSVVQEIEVASGRVVFEWHSLGHVPLTESVQANHEPARHATKKRPFDYFHVNSVADGPGGTVLISGRNTSAVYLLARAGHVVWRLGGKRSDFGPRSAVRFAFQHDARLHGSLLTLFDNGGIPRVEPYSRPVVLQLDVEHRRARIVRTFTPPRKIASPYEGNLQLLPDGGAVVGWGGIRSVSEFAPNGALRLHLRLPYGDTYRAFSSDWSGRPSKPPAVVKRGGTVYVSWNGSTAVERWVALGDDSRVVASAPWNGLETAVSVNGSGEVRAIRALDAHGRRLGTWRMP